MSKDRPRREPRPLAAVRTHRHPVFGEIPLVPVEVRDARGAMVTTWRFDLGWQPPLPPGAVRGDPRRQTFCCDTPRYFYLDQPRTCVQCGEAFVFGASEQKYWYETLGFRIDSTAVRCPTCRRRRRSDKAIARSLALAVTEAAGHPADAMAQLALAQATLAHVERFGTGDVNRAISACRRARKAAPDLPQALYWEARLQEVAGRMARAIEAYGAFLEVAGRKGRPGALRSEAESRLDALRPQVSRTQ